ncbi:phage minor capsid protein [Fredinandcohnia humi]
MSFRELPTPNYERDERKLLNYYKRALKELSQIVQNLAYDIEFVQHESLMQQIALILQELDASTKEWCEEMILKAFKDGQAQALVSLDEAKNMNEAWQLLTMSLLAKEQVEALIDDTYTDLLQATKNTERKVKQLVRSVVSDTMRMRAIQQYGTRTMTNEIVNKLTKKGLSERLESEAWVGIVDKAGRRWNLSTYAQMVVRTKLMQANFEGARVESIERGIDLAVISSHGAKDACRHFEGMVISLNGLTKGFKTYAELRASRKIFHPCCRHKVSPIRDIELLPDRYKKKHEEQMQNIEKTLNGNR